MTAITMQVEITRTLLELDDIVMTNASSEDIYQFGELTGSGLQWERQTATSPWVHGRRLRSARRSSSTIEGELYVVSYLTSTPTTHDVRVHHMLNALSQFVWTLSIQSTDGSNTRLWQYTCEPADVTPGESRMLDATYRWTTLQVSIPHSPLQSSGSW